MIPITTTLNAIREHQPCEEGWEKLLKFLGKTKPDDDPLRFSTILESNGVEDALWCLRSLSEDHLARILHLSADIAESVLYIYEQQFLHDDRPRKAIEATRDLADGKITAADAAWAAAAARAAADAAAAARAAADAAWAADAADAAARAAADAAAAARAAADAAWAARAAAARAADAARDAERKKQGELLIKYFG